MMLDRRSFKKFEKFIKKNIYYNEGKIIEKWTN